MQLLFELVSNPERRGMEDIKVDKIGVDVPLAQLRVSGDRDSVSKDADAGVQKE